jgi:hypothetical protein
VPRNDARSNKSRLDYFLVSGDLHDLITSCNISPELQNKLFDHKAITLTLNQNRKKTNNARMRPTISNKELDDELLEFLVAATMCETYLLHTDTPFVSGRSKDDILSNCGNIKKLVKECGPPVHLIIGALSDEEAITERSRKVTRLLIMQNNLPVREVTDLILSCDPDVFFETLMNNLRNEVCSHQTFMRKAKFKKIESTKNKLVELKKDYTANSVRIQETEQILNNLIDMEMRSELFKYKHFDILNAEKI